ncbi:MAG: transposase [Terracidiphilus sp.]
MANNGVRYSEAFRLAAVERMKSCETVVGLAKELGVDKRQLYRWRALLEHPDSQEPPPETERESLLRAESAQLKRALSEMALEVDFFKGALHKITARRQSKGSSGATASTNRSRN